ncbi:hypothetical protein [Aeoliella sp.]|uniref:hypothetical protein n=1 Tax=Aeoliella sp. TaxID=2795800 RepID=UPI003CCBE418
MWQWDGSIATAELGSIQLTVATAVGDRRVQLKTREGLLLATLWDMPSVSGAPLLDTYVRDDDLVCLTGPTDSFPFHTQLYWTLRKVESSPTPLAALSLLVSVRTDLLDTHPTIDVTTEAAARSSSELSVLDGKAYVVSLREDVTLVDFATPEDCAQQQLHAADDQRTTIERSLFGHFLEKGVIRSGRLFAALYAGEVTESQAAEVCEQLSATELPLTT